MNFGTLESVDFSSIFFWGFPFFFDFKNPITSSKENELLSVLFSSFRFLFIDLLTISLTLLIVLVSTFLAEAFFTGAFLGTGLAFPFAGLEDPILVDFFDGVFTTALVEAVFFFADAALVNALLATGLVGTVVLAFADLAVLATGAFLATAVFLTGFLAGFFGAGATFLATGLEEAGFALVVLLLLVEDTFFFAVMRKEFSAGYGFNEGWQALQHTGEKLLPTDLHGQAQVPNANYGDNEPQKHDVQGLDHFQ